MKYVKVTWPKSPKSYRIIEIDFEKVMYQVIMESFADGKVQNVNEFWQPIVSQTVKGQIKRWREASPTNSSPFKIEEISRLEMMAYKL